MIKRLLLIVGLITLVGLPIIAGVHYCSEPHYPNTPTGAVTAAVSFIDDKSIDKVIKYYTPAPAGYMSKRLNDLYIRCDDIDVSDVKAVLLWQKGDIARVLVSYNIVIDIYDQTTAQYVEKEVQVIKSNDRWLINETI